MAINHVRKFIVYNVLACFKAANTTVEKYMAQMGDLRLEG